MALPDLDPYAAPDPARAVTVSAQLLNILADLGVRRAFGVAGGAIAPFCDALTRSRLRAYQCRHESGAAFAALEASLTSRQPVAVFVTTGPGLANALNGIIAARWDGAKVILISGATTAAQRGRWGLQETSAYTLPAIGLLGVGPLFDFVSTVEDPDELAVAAQRLAWGVRQPRGFVAHIILPLSVQSSHVNSRRVTAPPAVDVGKTMCSPTLLHACVDALTREKCMLWVGFGARGASVPILHLAERLGCPVISSARAKGIFPENHRQFIGVTGIGGGTHVQAAVAEYRPAYTLVLGSRLGEYTSSWAPALVPTRAFLHVDLNDSVFGAAYPNAVTWPIQADIATFVTHALASVTGVKSAAFSYTPPAPGEAFANTRLSLEAVRPSRLMAAIQKHVVDSSDAVVLAESGNSTIWTNHMLRFRDGDRYRPSGLWGTMGQAVCGVVGLALARGGKAVAVVGDGAMLMNNEVTTAVQYNAPAVWIVLNDALLGTIEQGMKMLRLNALPTALPRVDFAGMARAMGATGMRVEHESDLDEALRIAMATPGPCVVDVCISTEEVAPFGSRIAVLSLMGA